MAVRFVAEPARSFAFPSESPINPQNSGQGEHFCWLFGIFIEFHQIPSKAHLFE